MSSACGVETKLVARKFDQLAGQADALRGGAGPVGAAAHGQVGIDVKTNRVVVAVPADERPGSPLRPACP